MSRIALVTGAGKGIGAACARALSDAGHRVALLARSADDLDALAHELPGESLVVPTDVTDPAALDAAFAQVEETWGPVEILVVNAGAGASSPLAETSDEEWQRMLDLNLTAPFRTIRRALPGMTEAGWGRVVVVASIAGKHGAARIAAYSASKHGVLGLVRSGAMEVARTGVTVNAVCPGYVDTPMTDGSVAAIAGRTGQVGGRGAHDPRAPAADRPAGHAGGVRVGGDALRRQRCDQRAGPQRRRRSGPVVKRINPASLAKPSGFSHAVVATGTTVFLAGQTGMDAEAASSRAGSSPQFEQALSNLLTALREAGGEPARPGVDDGLHRRHGRLPGAGPRDRRGLEAARRCGLPGDGRHRRQPALGRRGAGRGAGVRGASGVTREDSP